MGSIVPAPSHTVVVGVVPVSKWPGLQPWFVLGTDEAAPGVLCSVLGPSLQKGHPGAGACPEKGNEGGEGSREQV